MAGMEQMKQNGERPMETGNKKVSGKEKGELFGEALLLAAAVSLTALNLCDGYVLNWLRSLKIGAGLVDLVFLYALAHGFAALSLAAVAGYVLTPGAHRPWFFASAILASASALCSSAYAIGWWIELPQSMVWQDYLGIALQTMACLLAILAARSSKNRDPGRPRKRLLAAGACVAVSTLTFLLPPVAEPLYSVLTRALSLGAPAVLLSIGSMASERRIPPDHAEGIAPPTFH